jgi:hypothetical protein
MTEQLNAYKKALEQYHQEIDKPGWDKQIPTLLVQMERFWSKLNQQEREVGLAYAKELYQRRVNTCPS